MANDPGFTSYPFPLILDPRVKQLLLSSIFSDVPFDRNEPNGDYSLCLEASHAAPRILHQADRTGAAITQELTAAVQRHPNITLVPDTLVTNLMVSEDGKGEAICVGVEPLSRGGDNGSILSQLRANHGVVLASGGLAGIYQHSTNPAGFNALGSSVALASRAMVDTSDLEFVQFHLSFNQFLLSTVEFFFIYS